MHQVNNKSSNQRYSIYDCKKVTLISAIVVIYLVLSELMTYNTSVWKPSLVVDKSRKEKMPIDFNITFPNMPCHSKKKILLKISCSTCICISAQY